MNNMIGKVVAVAIGTVLAAALLVAGLAAAQDVWFYDEDYREYNQLPDESEATLYADVGAWCNDGSPRATYLASSFEYEQYGDASPDPPYDVTLSHGRNLGGEAWRGGWSKAQVTAYGTPIYPPAYASIPDLPNSPQCPG